MLPFFICADIRTGGLFGAARVVRRTGCPVGRISGSCRGGVGVCAEFICGAPDGRPDFFDGAGNGVFHLIHSSLNEAGGRADGQQFQTALQQAEADEGARGRSRKDGLCQGINADQNAEQADKEALDPLAVQKPRPDRRAEIDPALDQEPERNER